MTNLKNLQNEAQSIRLSASEKAVMRTQIFGPAPATQGYTVSHFHFFSVRFMPALAALLIVLLGGGTAYAAQAALPGDVLYTIKVGVNERVAEALAVSTEAKAAFHAGVAETRLEEAEALAVEGRLSVITSELIEENLETHLASAEAITIELKEENPDESDELITKLESVLLAHGSILATLGEESEDVETREHSTRLASRVSSRTFARAGAAAEAGATMALKVMTTETETATMSLEVGGAGDASDSELTMQTEVAPLTSTPEESEAQMRAAEQLRVKSKQYLAIAEEQYGEIEGTLDVETAARLEAQFEALKTQHAEGEAVLEKKDYATARAIFTGVMSDSTALAAYLRAEQRFNRNHLRSWVDSRFGQVFGAEIEIEFDNEKGGKGKGQQIENSEDNQDEDDEGRGDGEDGNDGEDGEDGKDGKDGQSGASGEIKINLGL